MTDERDKGQVALWKPDSTNPKAPSAKGTVVAHRDIKEGETLDIALWRNDSDNPKAPLMKGKISDKREQQGDGQGPPKSQPQTPQAPQGGDEDDPDKIPF